jgi:hypothetical protein
VDDERDRPIGMHGREETGERPDSEAP